tara:strand:+ start:152 stop:517 length:366 start_codon:yes stop_codon:yes gene_type:complete
MSDEDKEKYVSTEEATEDSFRLRNHLPIEEHEVEKIESLLKKIDNFLLEVYRPFSFVYFICALIPFIVTNFSEVGFHLLTQSPGGYGRIRYYLGEDVVMWIFVLSPLIILMVWKRLFHPND